MPTNKYFYPKTDFSFAALLEDNTEIILAELMTVIENEASHFPLDANWLAAHPDYVEGSLSINWKTFEFVFFGIKKQVNIEACPKTYEVIAQIPELITAQFSLMQPKTKILPHRGYSKIVLRAHLPLIVPEGNLCGIGVGEEVHYWKKGELVVFDDSFEHEAWNDSTEVRALLMFDIAKPGCGYSAREICKYKMDRVDDPFLLNIAPKETWSRWLNQGYFDEAE
ncbi:MAG: aspartyl/asparaginyl beta-hydroxylase domain-containing protein [Flavobacteriales bacterium]